MLEQDVDRGLEDDIVCVIGSKGVVDVDCVGVVSVDSEFGGGSLVDVCRVEHMARASKRKMWSVGGSQGRSEWKAVQMDGM